MRPISKGKAESRYPFPESSLLRDSEKEPSQEAGQKRGQMRCYRVLCIERTTLLVTSDSVLEEIHRKCQGLCVISSGLPCFTFSICNFSVFFHFSFKAPHGHLSRDPAPRAPLTMRFSSVLLRHPALTTRAKTVRDSAGGRILR